MARRKSSLTPQYQFDPRLGSTGRYVNKSTGKIVSQAFVDSVMEGHIDTARQNANAIAENLAEGRISLADYQRLMMEQMKIVNTQSAALAKGGWANMTQGDWGSNGRISRQQYEDLDKYCAGIESGKIKLRRLDGEINGSFLRTSDQFAQGGVQTYNEVLRREAKVRGYTHEQRVLDTAAKHCHCCVDEADHWEPIGTLSRIGTCTCANNCRCKFIFGVELDGSIERVG